MGISREMIGRWFALDKGGQKEKCLRILSDPLDMKAGGVPDRLRVANDAQKLVWKHQGNACLCAFIAKSTIPLGLLID